MKPWAALAWSLGRSKTQRSFVNTTGEVYLCPMRRFAAEYMWLPTGIQPRKAVVVNDAGIIASVEDALPTDTLLEGIICTGFVNAHCHLELSCLKGKIPPGTGMAGFIRQLQSIRDQFTPAQRLAAAQQAADEMYASGISAVGDISNGDLTLPLKQTHALRFHTFVEVFGLNPGQAQDIYDHGVELVECFPAKQASLTIHAPYSISGILRDLVYERARVLETPVSVHLLESQEEVQLFAELDGPLMQFLHEIGAPFQGHTYPTSTEFILNSELEMGLPMNVDIPFLFVHMTEADTRTLTHLEEDYFGNIVLCPGANQYIHGRLPQLPFFADKADFICIGTDSLASNHQLDMVTEMRILQENCPELSTELLLDWACMNGAFALKLEDELPCEISEGMPADLVHISGLESGTLRFTPQAQSRRLTGLSPRND